MSFETREEMIESVISDVRCEIDCSQNDADYLCVLLAEIDEQDGDDLDGTIMAVEAAEVQAESILSGLRQQLERLRAAKVPSAPRGWDMVQTSIEDDDSEGEECDQLGGGCICESCTRQIVEAVGMPEDSDEDDDDDSELTRRTERAEKFYGIRNSDVVSFSTTRPVVIRRTNTGQVGTSLEYTVDGSMWSIISIHDSVFHAIGAFHGIGNHKDKNPRHYRILCES